MTSKSTKRDTQMDTARHGIIPGPEFSHGSLHSQAFTWAFRINRLALLGDLGLTSLRRLPLPRGNAGLLAFCESAQQLYCTTDAGVGRLDIQTGRFDGVCDTGDLARSLFGVEPEVGLQAPFVFSHLSHRHDSGELAINLAAKKNNAVVWMRDNGDVVDHVVLPRPGLVFVSSSHDVFLSPLYDLDSIVIMSRTGAEVARLSTVSDSPELAPKRLVRAALDPTGPRVALGMSDGLFVWDYGAGTVRRLHAGGEVMPCWSPTGTFIAYVVDGAQLYTADPEGRESEVLLAEVASRGEATSWAPVTVSTDGRYVMGRLSSKIPAMYGDRQGGVPCLAAVDRDQRVVQSFDFAPLAMTWIGGSGASRP